MTAKRRPLRIGRWARVRNKLRAGRALTIDEGALLLTAVAVLQRATNWELMTDMFDGDAHE